MTIEEAQKHKVELENDINRMLQAYERLTKTSIDRIDFNRITLDDLTCMPPVTATIISLIVII